MAGANPIVEMITDESNWENAQAITNLIHTLVDKADDSNGVSEYEDECVVDFLLAITSKPDLECLSDIAWALIYKLTDKSEVFRAIAIEKGLYTKALIALPNHATMSAPETIALAISAAYSKSPSLAPKFFEQNGPELVVQMLNSTDPGLHKWVCLFILSNFTRKPQYVSAFYMAGMFDALKVFLDQDDILKLGTAMIYLVLMANHDTDAREAFLTQGLIAKFVEIFDRFSGDEEQTRLLATQLLGLLGLDDEVAKQILSVGLIERYLPLLDSVEKKQKDMACFLLVSMIEKHPAYRDEIMAKIMPAHEAAFRAAIEDLSNVETYECIQQGLSGVDFTVDERARLKEIVFPSAESSATATAAAPLALAFGSGSGSEAKEEPVHSGYAEGV